MPIRAETREPRPGSSKCWKGMRLMMMTLQEISDRLEIQDLFGKYAHAVDTCDWDLYRSLYTEDAIIDYSTFGAPVGTVVEIAAYLAGHMANFKSAQHAVMNIMLTIDGDTATGHTICFNPTVREVDGEERVTIAGLWYDDTFVRTAAGWRIKSRSQDRSYLLTQESLAPKPVTVHL